MSKSKKQAKPGKVSKKQLSKLVFEKLTGSLVEYHLKGKKLETRLEKVSRQLASDIVKVIKKETPQEPENVPVVVKKETRRKKRAKKEKAVEKVIS